MAAELFVIYENFWLVARCVHFFLEQPGSVGSWFDLSQETLAWVDGGESGQNDCLTSSAYNRLIAQRATEKSHRVQPLQNQQALPLLLFRCIERHEWVGWSAHLHTGMITTEMLALEEKSSINTLFLRIWVYWSELLEDERSLTLKCAKHNPKVMDIKQNRRQKLSMF